MRALIIVIGCIVWCLSIAIWITGAAPDYGERHRRRNNRLMAAALVLTAIGCFLYALGGWQ